MLGQQNTDGTRIMQYVYITRLARKDTSKGATKEEMRIVEEHFAYLEELKRRGVMLLAGRTTTDDEHTFGICVFEAASDAVARDIMNKDPAVWQNVMTAELHPFRVALMAGRPIG